MVWPDMLVTTSPGLTARAARHVLAGRDQADDVELRLQLGDGAQRAEHAGGAAHVELHLVHLGAGLERDAAGVEGDALADQHHRRLALGRAVVAQHDEARRLVRALRHREERAHAELLDLLAVEHLDLEAERLAELLRPARRGSVGVQWLPGRLRALARQRHAGRDRGAALQALLHRLRFGLARTSSVTCASFGAGAALGLVWR